ncbi:MAG: TIGR04133 family radical SAM/SPASM protein [Candidatus Hydrogenedentes bacterium]|nr:TIGR04133 family radical SAM/SPASM protein [Candidatus Hydrogenedentota bacterium]
MAANPTKVPWLKRGALNIFRRYRRAQTALHELTYLFWECTLRCDLCCRHCGSDCRRESETRDMPLADFLRVLDEVAKHQRPSKIMLALTGGEPLLRHDLEECGAAFRDRGFPWGMVSNGYSLTAERLARLLDSGLRSLTISLDGLEESHNWLRRRPDSFERTLNAVTLLGRNPGLTSDVVTCVNQKNYGELGDIRQLLIDKGIRRWRLFTIFPKGRAEDEPLLDISGAQLRDLLEFIQQTRREGSILASYSCEGFLGAYEGTVRDSFYWCRAGINVGSVLADGSISACPSLRGDYIQGNIYRDSFWDCWENRFQVMRDRSWTKTGCCADCSAYCWCEGNGLHLRDQQSGKLLRCHLKMLDGAGE